MTISFAERIRRKIDREELPRPTERAYQVWMRAGGAHATRQTTCPDLTRAAVPTLRGILGLALSIPLFPTASPPNAPQFASATNQYFGLTPQQARSVTELLAPLDDGGRYVVDPRRVPAQFATPELVCLCLFARLTFIWRHTREKQDLRSRSEDPCCGAGTRLCAFTGDTFHSQRVCHKPESGRMAPSSYGN